MLESIGRAGNASCTSLTVSVEPSPYGESGVSWPIPKFATRSFMLVVRSPVLSPTTLVTAPFIPAVKPPITSPFTAPLSTFSPNLETPKPELDTMSAKAKGPIETMPGKPSGLASGSTAADNQIKREFCLMSNETNNSISIMKFDSVNRKFSTQ